MSKTKSTPQRRRGRPPSDDSLSARVSVRFTEAHRTTLERLAEHNRETLSDTVRRLTVRQLELMGL